MVNGALIEAKVIGQNCIFLPFSVVYEGVFIGHNVVVGEHAIIGRMLAPTTAMVRKEEVRDSVILGNNISISAHAVLYMGIKVGDNSLIGDHTSILSNVEIGQNVLISRHVTINSDVRIGDNTRIMDNSHITGRVTIGRDVFISVGVNMANDNLFGKNGFTDEVQGPIIGDFVSVGVGATILPNVTIGNGSIIAAGTVVKENVPEDVIYGGNPGKIISRVPKFMRREKE